MRPLLVNLFQLEVIANGKKFISYIFFNDFLKQFGDGLLCLVIVEFQRFHVLKDVFEDNF